MALKIDPPSIYSTPALSLANCADGEKKTGAEEAGRGKNGGLRNKKRRRGKQTRKQMDEKGGLFYYQFFQHILFFRNVSEQSQPQHFGNSAKMNDAFGGTENDIRCKLV